MSSIPTKKHQILVTFSYPTCMPQSWMDVQHLFLPPIATKLRELWKRLPNIFFTLAFTPFFLHALAFHQCSHSYNVDGKLSPLKQRIPNET